MQFHPYADLFPMMPEEALRALTHDIMIHGLIEPIITYEGLILDGRNRFTACSNAAVAPTFVDFDGDEQKALSFVISKNLTRRHLDESQRAMVAGRIADMKEGRPSETVQICTVSLEDAGKKLNVSRRSVASAKKVLASGDENLVAAVDNGKMPVYIAAKIADIDDLDLREKIMMDARPEQAIKKAHREMKEKALGSRQMALPEKKYGVIYADPEWKYETYSENGMDRSADNHYPTTDTDEIARRAVSDIAADDCVLFLWATVPMLPDALKVMDSWGFTYKSNLVWVKDRQGTGYWSRNQHELLLIGTRGDVPAPAPGTQASSVISSPVGRHSAKPVEAYELIESYFPTIPKIELNARDRRDGWDVWGYEAPDI